MIFTSFSPRKWLLGCGRVTGLRRRHRPKLSIPSYMTIPRHFRIRSQKLKFGDVLPISVLEPAIGELTTKCVMLKNMTFNLPDELVARVKS
jgi:hypothetical protein